MLSKKKLLLNYTGFALLAAAGFLMNLIFFAYYETAVLGRFNLAYSIFKITSQFSIFGMHNYILNTIPKVGKEEKKSVFFTGLFGSLFQGIIFAASIYCLAEPISETFGIPELSNYLKVFSPVFIFLNLNKVYLWALNATEEMSIYGLIQSLRGILLLVSSIFLASQKVEPQFLALNFLVTELLVFLVLTILFVLRRSMGLFSFSHYIEMYKFGLRSVFVGVMTELNMKVDILCVGFVMGDGFAGIYSIYATFSEGLLTVVQLLRNFVNPKIAAFKAYTSSDLIEMSGRTNKLFSAVVWCSAVLAALGLWAYLVFLEDTIEVAKYHPTLLLLLFSGVLLCYKTLAFDNSLLFRGHPLHQSVYALSVILFNIVLNLTLTPLWGLYGTAFATSASIGLSMPILHILSLKKLGFSIPLALFFQNKLSRNVKTI